MFALLHRCYPTSPAKQDGRGSVLPLQNIWFSFGAGGVWGGGRWMRRIIVAETNVGVDQGRQLYCLIHPAVWCRERWPGWAVVVVPGWSWGLECFCFSFSQILLALFSTAAFSCYTRNQELWLPWDGNPLKTWTYCGLFRNICWRCSFMTTIRFLEKRRNNTNERGEINEGKLEIAGMWHKRGLCCQKRLQSWD